MPIMVRGSAFWALAALVVESLDELTPDAIESAARRARKQRAPD
jgi:hypothetical protein